MNGWSSPRLARILLRSSVAGFHRRRVAWCDLQSGEHDEAHAQQEQKHQQYPLNDISPHVDDASRDRGCGCLYDIRRDMTANKKFILNYTPLLLVLQRFAIFA